MDITGLQIGITEVTTVESEGVVTRYVAAYRGGTPWTTNSVYELLTWVRALLTVEAEPDPSPACTHGSGHPKFLLRMMADDDVDLSVCWESINVREISSILRDVAERLDAMPEDTTAVNVPPL